MKRLLPIVVLALAVPCLAFGQATPPKSAPSVTEAAPKPGPEHKKLEIWVGDWTFVGEERATPYQSASTFAGRASVRPILGGFFVEWHGEEGNGRAWQEIDGYDPATKRFFWHAFYADGVVEVVTYTIEGNTVSLSGTTVLKGKQVRMRGTGVFAPDLKSFVQKYDISLDGKTWIPSGEIRFTRTR